MDKLLKTQSVHITKCLTGVEGPPKTKHVRGIILGTHYLQGASQFFHLSHQLDLHANPIVCYKFFFVLHKILREGHDNCVKDSIRNADAVVSLGKHWYHHYQRNPYGMCIVALSKVIIQKMRFHKKYPKVPGSLSITGEQMAEMTGHDMNTLYELSLDLLDYMEEILKYEEVVFNTLDKSRNNSMTYEGQCRLTPIVQCVQDSATLYDAVVKLLFQLHGTLTGDALTGHRERFLKLYERLRQFFDRARQMQFFTNLIHIPILPVNPPNFLIQSELSLHQAPVVAVEEPPVEPEEEEVEELLDMSDMRQMEEQLEKERKRTMIVENEALQDQINRLKTWFDEQSALLRARIRSLEEELKSLVQQKTRLEDEIERLKHPFEADGDESDQKEKLNRLMVVYTKLRNEHVDLLRKNANANEELEAIKNMVVAKEREISGVHVAVSRVQHEHRVINERQQTAALSESQLFEATTQLMDLERMLLVLQQQRQTLQASAEETKNKMQEHSIHLSKLQESKREEDIIIHQLEEQVQIVQSRKIERKERHQRASLDLSQMQQKVHDLGQKINRYAHLQSKALLKSQCDSCSMRLKNVLVTFHDPESMNSRGSAELLSSYIDTVCQLHEETQSKVDKYTTDEKNLYGLLASLTGLTAHTSHTLLHLKAVSNGAQSLEQTDHMIHMAESIIEQTTSWLGDLSSGSCHNSKRSSDIIELWKSLHKYIYNSDMMRRTAPNAEDVGDLVDQEMKATDAAIEAAQRRFKELLDQSRAKLSGQQLEVNESILDSCTKLMLAIKVLVEKSKILQREIVAEGSGLISTNEFYKKHHRWTEGLISAAKAIGLGATVLVKEADRVVNQEAGVRPEQLEICSREISSSTVQLVVTSRVKAKPQSHSLRHLMEASSDVTKATGAVVSSAKCAAEIMDREITFDFSHLSWTQLKKTEMESQVKVLKLESQLTEELRRLGDLRKQHYKLEEMSVAAS